MRTRNPGYDRAAAVTRGRVAPNRAGSSGIDVTDRSNEGRATTIIFDGARVAELDDGEVLVTIGNTTGFVPEAGITGIKSNDNPTFNFACLVENIVKVGSTYYVPYIETTSNANIKLATATDRDGPWTANVATIFSITGVAWDAGTTGLYAPEIVEHDGTYYLFYSVILSGGVTGSSNAIGVATSATIDGTYVDSGAAVLSPSAAGLWDSRRVGEASAIFQAGQWVMAYMGEDSDLPYQESEKIGIATAPAATGPWTRHPSNPILDFGASGEWDDALVADPGLIYADGYYWMMYAGAPDSTPSTSLSQGLAYATDPLGTWTRYTGNPILEVGPSGAWDDVWAFRGGLLYEDGAWSGVYTGYDGANFKGGNFTLDITSAVADPRAVDIPIDDSGGYFTGTEVETALQELGADVALLNAGGVGHYEVIVAGTAPPVAVTNVAEDDWLYGFVAD